MRTRCLSDAYGASGEHIDRLLIEREQKRANISIEASRTVIGTDINERKGCSSHSQGNESNENGPHSDDMQ